MPLPNCMLPPPGPGETGPYICESYPEIRARQSAYWADFLTKFSDCPWPTAFLTRDPLPTDDYFSGYRVGQFLLNTVANSVWVAESVDSGVAVWNPVGAGIWYRDTSTISIGATVTVDSILLASFHMVRYIIELHNDTATRTKGFELSVVREGGALKDSLYNKLNQLNIGVNTVPVSGSMELQLTNNESFPVSVNLIRTLF